VDVDELGVGRDRRQERDPQGVARVSVDPAEPHCVEARPVSGTVGESALQPAAELLHGASLHVAIGEPVAVPVAVLRLGLEDAVEHRSLGSEDARGARQRAKE
jgi:hypothetical protein